MTKYIIIKQEKDNDAYYTLNWSPLLEADKYSVKRHTPAMAGIIELYFMDEKKKLRILRREYVWYGGIRNRLREALDPELEMKDLAQKKLLEDTTLYCRYTLSESIPDMQDIIFMLPKAPINIRPDEENDHSHRYEKIYVKEIHANKIVTVD